MTKRKFGLASGEVAGESRGVRRRVTGVRSRAMRRGFMVVLVLARIRDDV